MQEVAKQLERDPNMSPNSLMKHIQTKFDIVQESSQSQIQGSQSPEGGGNSPSPIKKSEEEMMYRKGAKPQQRQ